MIQKHLSKNSSMGLVLGLIESKHGLGRIDFFVMDTDNLEG